MPSRKYKKYHKSKETHNKKPESYIKKLSKNIKKIFKIIVRKSRNKSGNKSRSKSRSKYGRKSRSKSRIDFRLPSNYPSLISYEDYDYKTDKDWDILVHKTSVNDLNRLRQIKNDNGLKTHDIIKENWVLDVETIKYFGDYFFRGNNSKHIIKTIVENADHVDELKNIKDIPINSKYLDIEKAKQKLDKKIKKQKIYPPQDYYYTPGIYTHYIWNNLSYYGECWFFECSPDTSVIFGISTKILKDKPWIACRSMSYGNCIRYLVDDLYSRGNLNEKPDMSKLKKHITHYINEEKKFGNSFTGSHEIIFDEIPLEYIKVIFTVKKYIPVVKSIFPDIPVVQINNSYPFGPGNFNYKKLLEPYANKL